MRIFAFANANIRLDHTVTERGKVSIRVGSLSHDISTATVEWKQLAGSAVLNIAVGESQANLLTFDIPTVNRDEILQFEGIVEKYFIGRHCIECQEFHSC